MAKKKETEAKAEEKIQKETIEKKEDELQFSEEDYRNALTLLSQAQKDLAETKKKLEETEDRLLRTLAEYDNFKKRTVREKEELYFASQSDVIKKMLPVFDNFKRAQQFSGGEEYVKGVEMIVQQFFQITESMEIRELAKEGDEFDPNFHEAVFREEVEGTPENKVIQVLQQGYAIGDKVIRHAMVKVSG